MYVITIVLFPKNLLNIFLKHIFTYGNKIVVCKNTYFICNQNLLDPTSEIHGRRDKIPTYQ